MGGLWYAESLDRKFPLEFTLRRETEFQEVAGEELAVVGPYLLLT